jgi:putative peptide zinc metalloprotease protein
VLPDQGRLPLVGEVAIGRAAGSTVTLDDPTVSRAHARISATGDGGALIEDAGSSYGTWLDGARVMSPTELHDGARIRLGDQELLVERRRDADQAGRTIIVPTSDSLVIPQAEDHSAGTTAGTRFGLRPRVRRGYAVKRLEAAEGERRWVLRYNSDGRFVRMSDPEAKLFLLLDGTHSLADLVPEAERLIGPTGPAALVRLLSDLAERGLLSDDPAATDAAVPPRGRLARLATPRRWTWPGAGDFVDRLYKHGGWAVFTLPALMLIGVTALAGAAVFAYLVAARYGTPFVVASKLGIGGIIFLLGRFAVAAVHETAHALTMASFGRRVREAGLKLVLVFPYAYVDTSDAWFEPRRRRMAVSAAGPVSDLALGGLFSLCCLALPPGAGRDIFFQLAFGAYVASFFNLNPLLPRDGYQVLVDLLREPGLRERAREQLWLRISGRGDGSGSDVLARYSLFSIGWSLVGGSVAVAASLRYEAAFSRLAPPSLVWPVMAMVWVGLFAPVLAMVGAPLLERRRARAG